MNNDPSTFTVDDFILRPQGVPDGWGMFPVRLTDSSNGHNDIFVLNHLHSESTRCLMKILGERYHYANIVLARGATAEVRDSLITLLRSRGIFKEQEIPSHQGEPWKLDSDGIVLSNSVALLTTEASWSEHPAVITRIEGISSATTTHSWGWIYQLPTGVEFDQRIFYDMFARMSQKAAQHFWLLNKRQLRGSTPYDEFVSIYGWHGGHMTPGSDELVPTLYRYAEQVINAYLVLQPPQGETG